jgi:hypothetical protein
MLLLFCEISLWPELLCNQCTCSHFFPFTGEMLKEYTERRGKIRVSYKDPFLHFY